MRVLFVSHIRAWPLDCGGAKRTHALVRALAARHEVTLVLAAPRTDAAREAAEDAYRDLVRRVVWLPGAPDADGDLDAGTAGRALRSLLDFVTSWLPLAFRRTSAPWTDFVARHGHEFDAAFCRYGTLAPSLLGLGLRRVVVDADDLQYLYAWRARVDQRGALRKLRTVLEAARTWLAEQVLFLRAGRVLVCSQEDAARVLRRGTTVVPNGVTLEDGPVAPRLADSVLCVGNWRYWPNSHGLRWFMTEVWPQLRARRPGARLRIVGLDATLERLPFAAAENVELIPNVPSVKPFTESATVVVVPVFVGGGTRIKILESLACGTPVVTTPVGAAGLTEAFGPSTGREAVDGAAGMVSRLAEVLADPGPALANAERGARLVAERYTWDAVVRPVAEHFEEWVSARN